MSAVLITPQVQVPAIKHSPRSHGLTTPKLSAIKALSQITMSLTLLRLSSMPNQAILSLSLWFNGLMSLHANPERYQLFYIDDSHLFRPQQAHVWWSWSWNSSLYFPPLRSRSQWHLRRKTSSLLHVGYPWTRLLNAPANLGVESQKTDGMGLPWRWFSQLVPEKLIMVIQWSNL